LALTEISTGTSNWHTNLQVNSVFRLEFYQISSDTLKVVQIIKTKIYNCNAPSVMIIILKETQTL